MLILALLVLGINLGVPGEAAVEDETLYMRIGAEMFRRGEWVVPILNGNPAFYKPPLVYWGMMGSFSLFGMSVLAARLPVALSAVALVFLLRRFGERLWGSGRGARPALLFLTSFGCYAYGRSGMMEIPFLLLLTAPLYYVWRSLSEDRPWCLLPAGALSGLATLVKGPASLVVTGLVTVAGLLLYRRARWLLAPPFWAGTAAALLVAALWPAAVAARGFGATWAGEFVLREHLGKFDPGDTKSPLVFFKGLLFFLAPWTLIVAAAVAESMSSHRLKFPAIRFLLAWSFLAGLIFLLPNLKAPRFAMPLLPPLFLLAEGVFRWEGERPLHRRILLVTGGALFLVALFLVAAGRLLAPFVSPPLTGAIAAALGGSGWCLARRRAAPGTGFLAAALVLASWGLPAAKRQGLPAGVDAAIRERPAVAYRMHLTRRAFPALPAIPVIRSREEYRDALATGKWVMVMEHDLAMLRKLEPLSFTVTVEWTRWKAKPTRREIVAALLAGDATRLDEPCYLIAPGAGAP